MLRYRIELTEDERKELLGIATRGKAAVATIAHANVLLAVDAGEHAELRMTSAQAAAAYHVSERTVDNVKRRLAKAWEDDRNARLRTVDWQFKTADAWVKLKHLYPQYIA